MKVIAIGAPGLPEILIILVILLLLFGAKKLPELSRSIGKSLGEFSLNIKQGLNIPNSKYDDVLQENIYLKFLKKTKIIKYDAIGLSFVQNEKVIKKIKLKYPKKMIISKIENL